MEGGLIKQMRVRYSGVGPGNKEEIGTVRDQKIPPQKSQSVKKEKKKTQNWFRRTFSGLMNQNDDFSDGGEYESAVAAAAFAINSLEESSIRDQKKTSEGGPATSLSKTKSKSEDKTTPIPEPGRVSRRFSEKRVPISDAGPAPSIKKTPTFADKQLHSIASTKPESSAPKPDIPSAKQSASTSTEVRRENSTKRGTEETKADAWEKAQLDIIKQRYDKVNTTILTWENKKRTKAKHKIEKTESELALKRASALQHYQNEMETIDKIARGARTQAEKNQKNEELKVKEKANKIRSTGKVPATCFCF